MLPFIAGDLAGFRIGAEADGAPKDDLVDGMAELGLGAKLGQQDKGAGQVLQDATRLFGGQAPDIIAGVFARLGAFIDIGGKDFE